MHRRQFLTISAAAAAGAAFPLRASASVPRPYSFDASPPMDNATSFLRWMQENRGEDPRYLRARFDRFQNMVGNRDIWDAGNKRAFLMVPREEFCLPASRAVIYDVNYHDIGFGVTITGPRVVARMTSSIDVKLGEKVLEIGTGSGYQSAYLSNLTDKVWSIEIIRPLAERTRGLYEKLIERGYTEYRSINSKNADGYYGWEEAAPFDKIIVTCGIDHIPPPLLKQLKTGGTMVIPVGPPGAQHILKVVKEAAADGQVVVRRADIYNGRPVPFVPFTKLQGDGIKGDHNQR
ncbi:MAG: protein-L-isoaspartate(D-aspartate) O-methyltransferase [Alphaproteobacteria bacterium]|jgi:protein-L-isoaspartate(D-aspartate) O-methyltransferase|nr:protein-L-isoaspartate(D-aspartate) O-methyltransferase [Alphaproteobacteria bacterium]